MMMGNRAFWILVSLTCLLHVLDCVSTYCAITGANAEESNPVMAYVLQNYGWTGMFLSKAVCVSMILLITFWARLWISPDSQHHRSVNLGVELSYMISFVLMSAVVASNFFIAFYFR